MTDEVPEALEDMFKYGFYVWDSWAMKDIENKAARLRKKHQNKTDRKQIVRAEITWRL